MSAFSPEEVADMTGERRLARIATVGADGTPHVVPVGWSYNADDVLPPWQPRGIEVRGRGDAVEGEQPVIRIHPDHVRSRGLSPKT